MRMTFDGDDEGAYVPRREELSTQFAEWAHHHEVDADAGDVELLLDWKWGYGDGALGRWDAGDVAEFLLQWCPRKVVSPPELVESIPRSVAAYVDFLADEGLLAAGCSAAAVREACADLAPRFQREMADRGTFAMAKSLLNGHDDTEMVRGGPVDLSGDAATATADEAAELVAALLTADEATAAADLAAWVRSHPSGTDDLFAAALRGDIGPGDALGLLEVAGTVLGPDAERAALAHRDGSHGAMVTMWLLLRGAIEPSSVAPDRMVVGTVAVAAAVFDQSGPDGLVEFFGDDVDQTTDVLRHLWRAEHGRTVQVLEALGDHHPDARIVEAARRSLDKARSRA